MADHILSVCESGTVLKILARGCKLARGLVRKLQSSFSLCSEETRVAGRLARQGL